MSNIAAGLVAERGYNNIMVFVDGIPGWVSAGYSLETGRALPKTEVPAITSRELKGMLADVVVLDIRTEKVYSMGWIRGSQKIPLALLSERYAEIPREKRIVLVDHAGKQTIPAGRFLKTKGFVDVSRLEGGLMSWVGNQYELEK